MGCDIHVALEGRPSGEKTWWPLATDVYIMRNYPLFGALAGVRNTTIEPVSAPRGLPQDITEQTQSFYEDCAAGAHSASWVSYSELAQAFERARDAWRHYYEAKRRTATSEVDQWIDTSVQAILDYLATYAAIGFETRMVFFFDN